IACILLPIPPFLRGARGDRNLAIDCQRSTVNCQLSTVNYQLSTVNYQLFFRRPKS
ncbi:MAG: hypothetical protein HC849_29315, partial [Oscillatoriales cyanobacterium RU_3_3]|nr:hypothetical protein [Oscillatoriales cyanobacterium RU_3_3]